LINHDIIMHRESGFGKTCCKVAGMATIALNHGGQSFPTQ
jgi:hypothetical protein